MTLPDNQVLVIFGASGDLTKRKLLPALFDLYVRKALPERFLILGVARTVFSDAEFRALQKESLLALRQGHQPNEQELERFLDQLYYLGFDSDKAGEYHLLREKIEELRQAIGLPDQIVFYLATPPQKYTLIIEALRKDGMNKAVDGGWRRVVVEKPFGSDLASAQELNGCLCRIFQENEIYRIDHFLGKETVQNILVLRFSNEIFESLWNRNYIDAIEIRAFETLGVEGRGKYYEGAGALRDMIQNHLMQLMGFVAMEVPPSFEAELMRDEVAKVFRSLRPIVAEEVIRAQYAEGRSGEMVLPAYREEKEVAARSCTETYVAMRFFIDNWRWGGVPFYFYTGKRLDRKLSEIVIYFKNVPYRLFRGICPGSSCNKLVLRIDAPESISLKFGLKMPGSYFGVEQVSMDFGYDSLCTAYIADAYERLLLDVMQGDSTLYTRTDTLEMSWRFIDPLLQEWQLHPAEGLCFYPAGSEGPKDRWEDLFQ
ncbi:MAG: glucose-6-phosphate dehydrogenase [Odoribacter sp.]